jgi:DNA-binding NarL/FixJ family response regulator
MPVMNGMDAIASIRREDPRARIIVLTTYGGDVLARRALKAGASGYILKSTIRRDLLEAIRAGTLEVDIYRNRLQRNLPSIMRQTSSATGRSKCCDRWRRECPTR